MRISKFMGCIACLAFATSTAFGQFEVRELGEGLDIAYDLNNHWEFYNLITSPNDLQQYEDFGGIVEEEIEYDFINTGQAGSGRFADDGFEEPAIGGDDYGMDARAEVTIPAGTWSIGFGSDDGGQLTLQTQSGDTVAFDSTFNTNGHGNFRLQGRPASQVWFLGNRGHNWTGGTFTVTEETTALFHGSFHERGGGDNWEVAIAEGASTNPQNDGSWELLSDGAFDWEVSPTSDLPEFSPTRMPLLRAGAEAAGITIDTAGIQQSVTPLAGAVINTTGDGTDMSEGLNVVFASGNNTGNLAGNLNILANNEKVAAGVVHPHWTGSNAADLGGEWADGVKYPLGDDLGTDLVDAGFAGNAENVDQYVAWSSGEIQLEEGVTKLRIGVDDFRYLAIDTGQNGVAGDQPGEILLNSNGWTNAFDARGDGENNLGNNVQTRFTAVDVAEDGWYAIDIVMSEGGGGDSQNIYWDEGNEDFFPELLTFNSLANITLGDEGLTAGDFLVPQDKFRSVERGDIESIDLVSAMDGATVVIDISSDIVDADHIVLENDNFGTEINLAGATVTLRNVGGDLVAGDSFVPFIADTIVGGEDAVFIFPLGTTAEDWTNEVAMGTGNRITFTVCSCFSLDLNGDGNVDVGDLAISCQLGWSDELLAELGGVTGDIDGGGVGFTDFLTLSTNFGRSGDVDYGDGDFNCTNVVDFSDFLILSTNFGQGGNNVAAVPEPTAIVFPLLLTIAMLLRSRRRQ